MAASFPYTFVSCPCTNQTVGPSPSTYSRRTSIQLQQDVANEVEDDHNFDPHHPRANFSLYPYDHLLFCDECHQIKCSRCWAEESPHNWYCPSCLFEVPTSIVKSDGNRCTRSCYNCPICTSPLSINGLDQQTKDNLTPQDAAQASGPFILSCPSCAWTSLDSGIEFSKPKNLTEQLVRMHKASTAPALRREESGLETLSTPSSPAAKITPEASPSPTREARFASLSSFYKTQLGESDGGSTHNPYADGSYSSPSNLARIMQLYGGLSTAALKKSRERPQPMREALLASEGLTLASSSSDSETISTLQKASCSTLTTLEQRTSHPWNHDARFTTDLWPVPALLKSRRSKRCRACKHILIAHEDKKGITRYKIRLLAQNHIPRLTLSAFQPSGGGGATAPSAAFALTPAAVAAGHSAESSTLRAHKTVQFLLTLSNPLFEPVRVALATPAITPGRVQSRVTILCPSFEIGAGGDVWDEALGAPQTGASRSRGGGAGGGGGGGAGTGLSGVGGAGGREGLEERQPEAGKVWERGRNWTSVVVEVVPGSLAPVRLGSGFSFNAEADRAGRVDQEALREDDDVLEIAVLVRMEWDAEVAAGEGGAVTALGPRAPKESRELSFWTVLGAGRIVD